MIEYIQEKITGILRKEINEIKEEMRDSIDYIIKIFKEMRNQTMHIQNPYNFLDSEWTCLFGVSSNQ
jgi:hypothetical protein